MNNIESILSYYSNTPKEAIPEVKRILTWEKWFDPLGSDIEDAEWPGAFGTMKEDRIKEKLDKLEEEIINDADDSEAEWNEDKYDQTDLMFLNNQQEKDKPKPIAGVLTPMGMIPITEHTRAGRIFNFWTAHTNFRITPEIYKIVDNTDGVETLEVYTPYRWRISIGKAFNTQEVKQRILKNLNAVPE